MEPDFDSLPYVDQTKASSEVSSPAGIEINEDFHLDDVLPSVRNAYLRLKSGLQNLEPAPEFNPQKYYISLRNSRNFAFILIRKTLIDIVIMLPESVIRDSLNHHTLRPLSAAVQGFYNGECAAVRLHLEESFDEVIELVNKAARFVHRSQ